MLSDAELQAYFARIGYAGPREPTLAVLRGIVAGHATSIPFENVDVLLGRGAKLDNEALLDKSSCGGAAATASSTTRCCCGSCKALAPMRRAWRPACSGTSRPTNPARARTCCCG